MAVAGLASASFAYAGTNIGNATPDAMAGIAPVVAEDLGHRKPEVIVYTPGQYKAVAMTADVQNLPQATGLSAIESSTSSEFNTLLVLAAGAAGGLAVLCTTSGPLRRRSEEVEAPAVYTVTVP